jgi:hypothetical protein
MFRERWESILRYRHIYRLHKPADEFANTYKAVYAESKPLILSGNYVEVLGFLQLVIRHRDCPPLFAKMVNACFETAHVAYRVVDKTIVPIASEAKIEAIKRSFVDLAKTEFNGARAHLRNAAEELTAGHYADSVRESIHAVEPVARVLEPSADLFVEGPRQAGEIHLHPAMKSGSNSLFGYTGDVGGVRHANIEPGDPAADEAACAAFIFYSINKARKD